MNLDRIIRVAPALLACGGAFAHDGHGMPAWHWHATDSFGFALVLALAAVAVWISRDR